MTWHPIPHPPTRSTCNVYLMQAGGLLLPSSLVLLPGPDTTAPTYATLEDANKDTFYAPDFSFLIEHPPSKTRYLFDLGMRKDLENSPPPVLRDTLPHFKCFPESVAEILQEYGSTLSSSSSSSASASASAAEIEQDKHHNHNHKQHEEESILKSINAIIFSHLHYDHIGDAGAAGFSHAQLWVGPTSMTKARPGYPLDPESSTWTKDFPTDGSKTIVEFTVPDELLESEPGPHSRLENLRSARQSGKYQAVEQRVPTSGWFPLGEFERACDLFGDGSAYLIDATGHSAGHVMLLVRVRISDPRTAGASFSEHVKAEDKGPANDNNGSDDFVLLAGDCYHHPSLLRDPHLTARPPYSTRTIHDDPDTAVDNMLRTRAMARRENVWVVGAHDSGAVQTLSPRKGVVKGIVGLNGWRRNGWKGSQGSRDSQDRQDR